MATQDKELKMLTQAAQEFAKKELAPTVSENDHYPFGAFPDHLLEKAFELDFFHTTLPETAGGMDMGMKALCALLEPMCQEDASFGGIIFTTAFAHELILQGGGLEVLKPLSSAEAGVKELILAYPVFNNPSEIETSLTARKDKNQYRLSGHVDYLVLGNIAAKGLVPAKINGNNGYAFFLIDLADSGVSKSDPVLSLGMHACPAVDVRLKNVEGILIGDEQKGAHYFEQASNRLHVAAAAMALGVMKGSFNEGLSYVKEREQGGRKIINWSEMQMIMADFALKIELSQMAVAQAGEAVDKQSSGWGKASLAAALHTGEMACQTTTDGIQVLGGVGYTKDFGQEKRFRDARHVQSLLGSAPMKKIRYIETKYKIN